MGMMKNDVNKKWVSLGLRILYHNILFFLDLKPQNSSVYATLTSRVPMSTSGTHHPLSHINVKRKAKRFGLSLN